MKAMRFDAEHYTKKGWVHIPQLIDEDIINSEKDIGGSLRRDYEKYSEWKGISCAGRFNEDLFEIYTSQIMYDLTRQILGDVVYLFNDQIIIKLPNELFAFPEHYDNQYGPNKNLGTHTINILWVLDDITVENGSLEVKNADNERWNTPVLKRGDVLVINGNTLHRSDHNKSADERGLYACVYADKPITVDGFYREKFIR
jgi:ectoine hydroxylase-related dioxygenase (phytanoyl-CoA dioxygenase family)